MGCYPSVGLVIQSKTSAHMALAPSHVLIVGGGILGASTAYYLSLRKVKVTILEQAAVACHSSGKAAGFLASDWNDAAVGNLSRHSFKLHQELAARFGAEHIGYRSMSCVGLGFGGMHQEGGRAWLDKTEGKTDMGTEASLAQVHPRKLTEMLVKESGAQIVFGRAVGVEIDKNRVIAVKTAAGETIDCEAVLFAMGAWTQQCVAWFPTLHTLLKDTVGKKYTTVILDAVCDNTAVFLDSEHQVEIYPRVDEVYVNGCPMYEALPVNPLDIEPSSENLEIVRNEASRVSSKLANAKLKTSTACFLPSSADGFPVLGQVPDTINAYVACGHTCWGILNGPASGKAMAELIVDGHSSCVDLEPFSAAREPEKCCLQ